MIIQATPTKRPPAFLKGATSPLGRLGLTYQRRFDAALRALTPTPLNFDILSEPWLALLAASPLGKGTSQRLCSPDIVVLTPYLTIVFEIKLRYTPVAYDKLLDLYLPAARLAYSRPAAGITVCKFLTPDAPRPLPTISAALGLVGAEALLHWRDLRHLPHGGLAW